MKYTEFRDAIQAELHQHPEGKTWRELKHSLNLPYDSPCYEWLARMEQEIGLERSEKLGRAFIWKLGSVRSP